MVNSETYAIQALDVDKTIRAVNTHVKHFDEQKPEASVTTQTHSIIDEEV